MRYNAAMNEDIETLQRVYGALTEKCASLRAALKAKGLKSESGFYNNHYRRNEYGEYVPDAYPIPVISVDGVCDIEVDPRGLGVSSKLSREAALAYDYASIPRKFELYGVDDYLRDFYREGMSLKDVASLIEASSESEIGAAFPFGFDDAPEAVADFIVWLKEREFYY